MSLERCENMTINLPEKVMTNILEIWNSKNITINVRDFQVPCWRHFYSIYLTLSCLKCQITHSIYTSQVDMCDDVTLNYTGKKEYQQVVWSNCNRLRVTFRECPEHNSLVGLEQMKSIYPDVSDAVDQFFLRFVGGVITSEVLIRLPGGFPTTTREADEWEAEHPHDIKFI